MKIFLAKYEHSNGTDEVAFTTRVGAQDQLQYWADQHIDDWQPWDHSKGVSLVEQWADITCGNEFLFIDELPLNEGRGPGTPQEFNK
jgi:hypothetical protein